MNVSDLIKSTLQELQELMESKTVVGNPIEAGDHTVIPVSKIAFGFGGGGGNNEESKGETPVGGGEGIGGGWTINPIAFVVVGPEGAKLLTIGEKESAVTKLMDLAPKVVDTVKDMVDKKVEEQDNEEKDTEKKKASGKK